MTKWGNKPSEARMKGFHFPLPLLICAEPAIQRKKRKRERERERRGEKGEGGKRGSRKGACFLPSSFSSPRGKRQVVWIMLM